MPFRVAGGIVPRSIVGRVQIADDLGTGGFCTRVVAIDVIEHDVDALGDASGVERGLPVELRIVVRAQHYESWAELDLGVRDRAVRSIVQGMFLETEGAAEPVDGCARIAVLQAGNDAGVGLRGHGRAPIGSSAAKVSVQAKSGL